MQPAQLRIVTRHGQRNRHQGDERQVYEHLLATATDAEHRAALKLMPMSRFAHLPLREAYIAAMAEVCAARSPRSCV
jgi:hypothetical protein